MLAELQKQSDILEKKKTVVLGHDKTHGIRSLSHPGQVANPSHGLQRKTDSQQNLL